MTRAVGIDPGTVSIDVCGMADGQLYLDRSWPTDEALAHPDGFIEFLTQSGPPDLIAGPSPTAVRFSAAEEQQLAEAAADALEEIGRASCRERV